MFIFTLFIFIKYECNFIYNLMFFHLQIRCSSCLHLALLENTSSSTPGGLIFDWSAGADPMHDELCTYFVMLWFMITNIITVCSMLTQHKITVIYKHETHIIQLVCSMNNVYSYKLSKQKKFKLISHFLFKFSLYLHIYCCTSDWQRWSHWYP